MNLDDDSREIWLRLQPGSNTLAVTGTNIGTLSLALRWVERRR